MLIFASFTSKESILSGSLPNCTNICELDGFGNKLSRLSSEIYLVFTCYLNVASFLV